MSVICKVDGREFKDEKSLHFALKKYGLIKQNIIKHIMSVAIF